MVKTTKGSFVARAVIIAGGCERCKLGIPGEDKFTGKKVSYYVTYDAAFFREQPVAVAGGDDDVGSTEAIYLDRFASKVTVI